MYFVLSNKHPHYKYTKLKIIIIIIIITNSGTFNVQRERGDDDKGKEWGSEGRREITAKGTDILNKNRGLCDNTFF